MHAVALLDQFAKYAGVLRWMRHRCFDGITILMYHKVLPTRLVPDYPLPSLVVEQSAFDAQMDWLAKHFDVRTVSDALEIRDRRCDRSRNGRPIACVTFDDGYRDNFEYAAPILESRNLPGTFFITTGFVDGRPMWFDRAALIWRRDAAVAIRRAIGVAPQYCEALAGLHVLGDWMSFLKEVPTCMRDTMLNAIDQTHPANDEVFGAMLPAHISQLASVGHEIGAHSVTHPILTSLDDATLHFELENSRTSLAALTGKRVDGFCYPNGNCDERVMKAVLASGYRYACVVRRGMVTLRGDRMALPRRAIMSSSRRETPESFESEVVGWHDLLRQRRPHFSSPK